MSDQSAATLDAKTKAHDEWAAAMNDWLAPRVFGLMRDVVTSFAVDSGVSADRVEAIGRGEEATSAELDDLGFGYAALLRFQEGLTTAMPGDAPTDAT